VVGLVMQRSHLVTGDEGHYAGVVRGALGGAGKGRVVAAEHGAGAAAARGLGGARRRGGLRGSQRPRGARRRGL
jgi:hypothetical protein